MDEETILTKYEALSSIFNERTRRAWAASEAIALGYGGIALVSRATGVSRSTIERGIREIEDGEGAPPDRVRKSGAGRKRKADLDPTLVIDLEGLIEPSVSGDPQSALRWTSKSTRRLARELQKMGHEVSHAYVGTLLGELGYSLQANRRAKEGRDHPDRDKQFRYINRKVRAMQRRGQPVISVDTKKKELVGNFRNAGQEWRPAGDPELVRVHDFIIPDLGKAIPYGVYDLTRNAGWVSIGINHDTSTFAVNSIRGWWKKMGHQAYCDANELLITADGGGSNGSRTRLWKLELQEFANETGMAITVCHFPPGTSKWNKIEHRMFSYISKNWRAKPLTSIAVIVNLIAATTTETGLRIRCELDKRQYRKGRKVLDADMLAIKLKRHRTHGNWNYTIRPQ